MGFDVKITTFSGILDLIAPHSCRGCGQLGEVLCKRCKNYNIGQAIKICSRCKKDYEECKCEIPVFAGFYREGLMMELVEDYKYQSIRDLSKVLAEILDEILPKGLGGGLQVVIVPLPTAPKHIRERGFDHTLKLAKALARRRKEFSVARVISRYKNTVQVGANAKTRKKQAREAYEIKNNMVRPDVFYLLLDDIWTTGASMEEAILLMKKAGAKHLATAVILTAKK